VKRDRPARGIGDDGLREVARPSAAPFGPHEPTVEVLVIRRVERPTSFECTEEVGGRHDLAVRVSDPAPQLERVGQAAVGRCRYGCGKVGDGVPTGRSKATRPSPIRCSASHATES
jgi:hypothetical protein